jgi:hypothetical protein
MGAWLIPTRGFLSQNEKWTHYFAAHPGTFTEHLGPFSHWIIQGGAFMGSKIPSLPSINEVIKPCFRPHSCPPPRRPIFLNILPSYSSIFRKIRSQNYVSLSCHSTHVNCFIVRQFRGNMIPKFTGNYINFLTCNRT